MAVIQRGEEAIIVEDANKLDVIKQQIIDLLSENDISYYPAIGVLEDAKAHIRELAFIIDCIENCDCPACSEGRKN